MTIKARLYLGTALSVLAATLLVVVLLAAWQRISRIERWETTAHGLYKDVSELNTLTYDYLMHHEERMEQQWRRKYRSLSLALNEGAGGKSEPDYEEFLDRIGKEVGALGSLFDLAVENHKKNEADREGELDDAIIWGGRDILEARFVARLLVTSQAIITEASRLTTRMHNDGLDVQITSAYITLSLVLLLALGQILFSAGLTRSISSPLSVLEKAAEAIGSGNLEHEVPIEAEDEIGRLASAFNRMTRNLRVVTASRDELDREVEERREAEKKLSRFWSIVENSDDAIIGKTLDGVIVSWNLGAERIYGYSAEEIVGKPVSLLVPPEVHDQAPSILEEIRRGEKMDQIETVRLRKDGRRIDVSLTISPVRDEAGNITGASTIARDITANKLTEARIEGLNEFMEALIRPGGPEEKSKLATDALVRILDVDFARIWVLRPGDRCDGACHHAHVKEDSSECPRDRCLHLIASSGRYTHIDGEAHRRVPIGRYKIGRIASGEIPGFLTNDVTEDPRVHDREWAKKLGLVSFAGNRLLSQSGEVIGVLAVFSKHLIGAEEEALLKTIGNTTAHVLHGAITEKALRESEERFRASFEQAAVGVGLVDSMTGRFLRVNQRYCDIVRYTKEEMMARDFQSITHPDTLQADLDNMNLLLEGKIREFSREKRYIRKDGSIVWVNLTVSPMWSEGEAPTQHIAIVEDITDRKRAEEELHQYAETQAVLLREVNHRVKNNLAAIVSMIQGETDRASTEGSEAQIEALSDLERRVLGLATVHGMLSASEWRPLVLADLFEKVALSALRGVPRAKAMEFRVSPSPVTVNSDQAHHLALVINELTTNAVKYALADRQSALVDVAFSENNGRINIIFQDNGPGFSEQMLADAAGAGNMGYDLVFGIVGRSLRGDVSLANSQGAVVTISFPAAEEKKEN